MEMQFIEVSEDELEPAPCPECGRSLVFEGRRNGCEQCTLWANALDTMEVSE